MNKSSLAILLVPLAVAAVVTLFVWPSARLEPRDLPIGVAGSPSATRALEKQLGTQDGRFEFHEYADQAAARQAIEDREIYGAVVATPDGTRAMTASAASPMVAQAITRAAAESQPGVKAAEAQVQDVVSAGPHGAALSSSVFPLIIAGMVTALVSGMGAPSTRRRIGRLVFGSALAGITTTALIQSWLDVIGGDWVANAAAFSLTALAVGATVAGLRALMGERGLALGALLMVFLGNPFSAMGSAPELLPQPVGGLGQLLPPGAGGNLVRSTGFFDGAGAGGHIAVLFVWALGGLALLVVSGLRERRLAPAGAPVPATS